MIVVVDPNVEFILDGLSCSVDDSNGAISLSIEINKVLVRLAEERDIFWLLRVTFALIFIYSKAALQVFISLRATRSCHPDNSIVSLFLRRTYLACFDIKVSSLACMVALSFIDQLEHWALTPLEGGCLFIILLGSLEVERGQCLLTRNIRLKGFFRI